MPVIGLFRAAKDGGWEGRICTLSVNMRPRFVPNDNKTSPAAPDFLVTALGCQIGSAWSKRAAGNGKAYLRVCLDDPFQLEPVSAALFPNDDGLTANLVWGGRQSGGLNE